MFARSIILCFALVAAAAATNVSQCAGESFPDLQDNVNLKSCKSLPCKLKKGKDQVISIAFTPNADTNDVINQVKAEVFGVPLPFVGVDGSSICDKLFLEDDTKASCPLKANTKYIYKDSFPVLSIYPSVQLKVNWALTDGSEKKISCFDVPAKIIN